MKFIDANKPEKPVIKQPTGDIIDDRDDREQENDDMVGNQ